MFMLVMFWINIPYYLWIDILSYHKVGSKPVCSYTFCDRFIQREQSKIHWPLMYIVVVVEQLLDNTVTVVVRPSDSTCGAAVGRDEYYSGCGHELCIILKYYYRFLYMYVPCHLSLILKKKNFFCKIWLYFEL